jgi:hypothetical protein
LPIAGTIGGESGGMSTGRVARTVANLTDPGLRTGTLVEHPSRCIPLSDTRGGAGSPTDLNAGRQAECDGGAVLDAIESPTTPEEMHGIEQEEEDDDGEVES